MNFFLRICPFKETKSDISNTYINAAANRREGLEATPVNKASDALLVNIGGPGNLYSPQSLVKMFWSFPLPTLVTPCQIIVSILTRARAMSCQSS